MFADGLVDDRFDLGRRSVLKSKLKLSFIILISLWDVKFGLWGKKFKSKESSGKTCCAKPPLLPDLETSADHPELFRVPANTEIGAKSTHLTYRPRIFILSTLHSRPYNFAIGTTLARPCYPCRRSAVYQTLIAGHAESAEGVLSLASDCR